VNYLANTNLVSEPTKPRPNPLVLAWLRAHSHELYVSSVSIAEVRRGIERLPFGNKKIVLHSWLTLLCERLEGQILSFNSSVAHIWGQLAPKWESKGITIPLADSYIAATARRYKLTVVTRNVSDFQKTGIRVINPCSDSE